MSSKNPFVNHCLSKHPMVSDATARMMEIAWDEAIGAVISVVRLSKGRKISLTGLKKLLSTKQREGQDTGNEVDVVHLANYEMVKKLLTPAQEKEVSEIWQLTGKVAAIRKVREITGCGLFEAVCYMRYNTGEKR